MRINPANASELATIAREVGGEILEGALHYPSETGSWQLGGVELGEYLAKHCDQRLMIILVPLSKATKETYIGSICGFIMRELQGFPRCKSLLEYTASIERCIQEHQQFFESIERYLERGEMPTEDYVAALKILDRPTV